MVTEFLFIVTAFTTVLWYFYEHRLYSKGKRLPGPVSLPFIGGALELAFSPRKRNYEVFEDMCAKYGHIVGFNVGFNNFVLTDDFELTKTIMSLDDWHARLPPQKFMLERSYNKNLGLIWSWGASWKEMRKYTNRIMRDFGFGKGAIMESFIQEEVLQFLIHFDQIRKEKNDIVYINQLFNIPTLNLLWTMMGIRFSYDDKTFVELIQSSEDMRNSIKPGLSLYSAFPFLRFIPGLTEHDAIISVSNKVQNVFKEIIDKRRTKGTYLENPEDFLDIFLKEIDTKKPSDPKYSLYTEEQMIMVCVDLFFTSSDTTSSALGFAIIYMILNPKVMSKVREEIDRVVGPNHMPNLDDKNLMPYVEATTLEILRFSSINPIAARSPNKDFIFNGYFIPKDAIVVLQLHSIHFNEKMFPDPFTFRPERFLNKNMEIVNADKILPFGYGKRICMGENLAKASFFTFFSTLMQRYTFEKSPFHPEPTLEPLSGLTNTPEPFYVRVNAR